MTPVEEDVRARVGKVLDLLEGCAAELFDAEFGTAVRRLRADVVAADPAVVRRGRPDTAAAAIAWLVGKANEMFDPFGDGLSIGDLTAWFGLNTSPSQRDGTMLAALGIESDAYRGIHLGSPRYLTAAHRQRIIQRRELADEHLDSLDNTDDGWAGADPWDDDPLGAGDGWKDLDGLGTAQAYELDVTLAGVRPRIWRRIAITADATFGDLHHAIQEACGWDDAHLFVFRTPDGGVIGGSPFEDPFGDPVPDADEVGLAGYFAQHERCQYEYDFGGSGSVTGTPNTSTSHSSSGTSTADRVELVPPGRSTAPRLRLMPNVGRVGSRTASAQHDRSE